MLLFKSVLLLFLDVYCIYFICALSQSSQSKDLFIAFWRMRSVSSCLSRHQWWEEMSVRARAGVRELRPSGPGENGGKRKGKQNEIASETGIIIIEGILKVSDYLKAREWIEGILNQHRTAYTERTRRGVWTVLCRFKWTIKTRDEEIRGNYSQRPSLGTGTA